MNTKTLKAIHLIGSQYGKRTGWQTWPGYVRVDFADGSSKTYPESGAVNGTLATLRAEGVNVADFEIAGVRGLLANSYPPKPDHVSTYQGAPNPRALGRWQWSVTFGRWGRYVTRADGSELYTYPAIHTQPDRDAATLAALWVADHAGQFTAPAAVALTEATAYFSRPDVRKY